MLTRHPSGTKWLVLYNRGRIIGWACAQPPPPVCRVI